MYVDLPDFPNGVPLDAALGGAGTQQRPDLVLRSETLKKIVLLELTVPSEHNVSAAHERKTARYLALTRDLAVKGWTVELVPFEVGSIGFLTRSYHAMTRLLGIGSKTLSTSISDTVLRCSYWIFLSRGDQVWTPWAIHL